MTVRLIAEYQGTPAGARVSLGWINEERLVAQGKATYNLDGSFAWPAISDCVTIGPIGSVEQLTAAYPPQDYVGLSALVGSIAPFTQYTSNGVAWSNLAAELADIGVSRTTNGMWQPPAQPSFLPGGVLNASAATAEQFISTLWEPLRAANPSYITRTLLGKDQSGLYDIWRYEFTPQTYDKTIILLGSVHGLEVTGQIGLYLLMKQVIENTASHANLMYLRSACRIIIIPIVNPWGMNQSTRERRNSRLIDPNRNADYRWGNYTESLYYEKGTAPWSEKESQLVRDTVLAFPDASALIDCHNTTSSGSYNLYGFIPQHEGAPTDAIRTVIDGIKSGAMTQQIATSPEPLLINWAATQGLNSMVIEWNDGKDGNAMYSSADLTLALRWYGNLIMQIAPINRAKTKDIIEPRAWEMQWRTGVDVLAFQWTTYTELLPLQMTLPIDGQGILTVTGTMTVAHSTTADNVFVCPKIGQANTNSFSPSAVDSKFESYARLADAADRITIPFCATVPVFQTGDFAGRPVVGMYTKTTSGAASVVVQRYRMNALFIPTEASARVEHYDATGRLAMGVGALLRTYPSVAT